MAKGTPELQSRLAAATAGQDLDLVLEMGGSAPLPPAGRATSEFVDSMRNAFKVDFETVHRLIEEIGGSVVDENWLNRVVKVRVPAQRVTELLHSPDIDVIDVPHRLTRA